MSQNIICINCDNKIQINDKKLKCSSCEKEYPLLNGRIPILIKDWSSYLASKINGFINFRIAHEKKLKELKKLIALDDERQPLYKEMYEGLAINFQLLEQIYASALELIDLKQYAKVLGQTNHKLNNYEKSFVYLIRDWCSNESDNEIEIIVRELKKMLLEVNINGGNCLWLGVGTGRIMMDMASHFNTNYGVDASLLFASLFDRIQHDESIEFYDWDLKNCFDQDDMVRKYIARLTTKLERLDNINYILADANELPVENGSVDVVISLCFTDVMPLPALKRQLERVLKPGGYFIHLGPLKYHHEDLQHYYSAEELLRKIESWNYQVSYQGKVRMSNTFSKNSMASHDFNALSFIAKKLPRVARPQVEISDTSIVSVAKPMDFKIQGKFSPGEEASSSSSLILEGVEYQNAELIIEFFKWVDGSDNIHSILNNIDEEIGIEDKEGTLTQLKNILKGFHENGFIEIS